MNGKNAKVLRGRSLGNSIGRVSVKYKKYSPPVYGKVDVGGGVVELRKIVPGVPRELIPTCARAIYLRLKREAKT